MRGTMTDITHPAHVPAEVPGPVYVYDYACNWWVGPDGHRVTQEELVARLGHPGRAPLSGTRVVES